MGKIVQAIYDKKQVLWFNFLKRVVESQEYLGRVLYNETFRAAIKKLRDVNILENNNLPHKSKRVSIRLTNEAYEKYKIGSLQIPETYQLESSLRIIELKRQPTIRKRRRRDWGIALHEKIIQYFLSRAALGCHYNIELTGRPWQKGDYTIFKDEKGHYHGPQDMIHLTEGQKNKLISLIGSGSSIPGVSINDLVDQRDSNCAGIFRYLKVTKKVAKKILDELVKERILVPMNNKSNISESPSEIRYVIANPLLSSYISEHYELLFVVSERMGLIWLADHPTKEEREWNMYYYGMPQTSNRFANIKKLKTDKVECPNSQIKQYDQIIVKRIEAIRNNHAYNKIRSDYKALCNVLKKTIEPYRNRVRMYNDFYNF